MRLTDLVTDLESRLETLKQRLGNEESTAETLGSESDPECDTWMSPQQQKLELLKKAVGVESEYDEEESDCGCEHEEMTILKRNAGILDALGDDDWE
jgi:hypothetical protein